MPPVRHNETQNQIAFDRKIRGHGRLGRVATGLLGRTLPIGTKEQAKKSLAGERPKWMGVNHANMWDPLADPLALQTSGDDFQRERVIQRREASCLNSWLCAAMDALCV